MKTKNDTGTGRNPSRGSARNAVSAAAGKKRITILMSTFQLANDGLVLLESSDDDAPLCGDKESVATRVI